MSREHVKAFYSRLATDEAFRTQIETAGSKDKCSKIVQAASYYFTPEEFEAYTVEFLESNVADDSLRALSEKEHRSSCWWGSIVITRGGSTA